MIDATHETWDAHVKVDPNSRLMRYKIWPYYEDWCEIFDKDRAIGGGAEDIGEASNAPTGMPPPPPPPHTAPVPNTNDDLNGVSAGWTDENEPAASTKKVESSNTTGKKLVGHKRKLMEPNDAMSESVMKFCSEASKWLGDIATRIGYEVDLGIARKEVFHFVNLIDGLTLQEKLQATKLLGQNTEDLEIFSSLPDEVKEEWTRMKLAGHL